MPAIGVGDERQDLVLLMYWVDCACTRARPGVDNRVTGQSAQLQSKYFTDQRLAVSYGRFNVMVISTALCKLFAHIWPFIMRKGAFTAIVALCRYERLAYTRRKSRADFFFAVPVATLELRMMLEEGLACK